MSKKDVDIVKKLTHEVMCLQEDIRLLKINHGLELNKYADSVQADFAERLSQLTPHQFTVLKMMSDGLLNKQIAYELSISESTVKQHVSAVLRKLNVINRTKAGVLFRQLTGAD